ncbi:MAG: T9SS type A sorting domain-containing protein [Bacteroidetes bacterium]|nr:T9SS type A sorting domain-containing protein [Bacteroidota bacterium]
MKRLVLILSLFGVYTSTFSQVVVQVVSNPCNPASEQSYNFEIADWTNSPDMLLPANSVQAELVFVNDGTTPGVFTNIGTPPLSVETTTDACEDSLWTQDLTGKIAVIWRGGCEFSCKVDKAQNRGAIGVIIINHTGDAVGMAEGTCGINVTIPVVMIGRTDGENLMTCIAGSGVIAFIGNNNGLYANNMSSDISNILMTESSAIPWDLAQNGIEYPVDFGLWAYNKGFDAQNGVTATVDVVYNGLSVYNQTSAPVNFAVTDTIYFDLGTYAPALWNVGTYTATYTINDTNDQDLSDNVFSFEFKFTSNEDVYAKCRLDSLNQPIHNTAFSLNETGCNGSFENCIVFKNEYAGTRNAMVTGMTFSSRPIGFTITSQYIEIRTYQWNDVFADINSPVTFSNLSLLDSSFYIYNDNTLIDSNIFLPFTTPIALQDNQRYLFCVFNPGDSLRTGYDTQLDYTTTINHYLQPISPVSTVDLCSSNNKVWYRDGFGFDAVPAISVTMDIATSVNETAAATTFYPYPNPTNNLLTIPVRQHVAGNARLNVFGQVKLEVFDMLGKVVLTENKMISNEPFQLNVASMVNGNYLFKLTFSDGTSDVFKVSVNR